MNASFFVVPYQQSSSVSVQFLSHPFFCPVDDPAFMDHIPQPLDMGIKEHIISMTGTFLPISAKIPADAFPRLIPG